MTRNFKRITPSAFGNIALPLLQDIPSYPEVDGLVSLFYKITNKVVSELAPLQLKRIKTCSHKGSWFNDEVVSARRTKRAAERQWRLDQTPENRLKYREVANLYKATILQAKRESFTDRIKNAHSNSRELFHILRELEGKNGNVCNLLKDNDWCEAIMKALMGKVEMHLSTISHRQKLMSAEVLANNRGCLRPMPALPPFSFRLLSEAEVASIIGRLKATSCKGDLCPADIIKKSLDCLVPLITKIANLSFSSCHVPAALKDSWITPLLKKEGLDPRVASNYRPITNVLFLLKILDAIAYSQVQGHLESQNLLDPRQSGFRATFGTETALTDLKANMTNIIDTGSPVLLLLLDLSAAFDLVDHNILVDRLGHVANFSEGACRWIHSFLDGRKARVFSDDSVSAPVPLSCGVPQGSCLSPTMYNVYTRPLFDLLNNLGVGFTNYADDTQIYLPLSGDYEKDAASVSHIYGIIQDWMAANSLALNNDKTELIIFGTRQRLATLEPKFASFVVGGQQISVASKVKTLGVTLDSHLTMRQHVACLSSSCAYINKLLVQIRPYLSVEDRAVLAGALINSRLDYCNSLLAGTSEANINRLQVIQNNAVRAVHGLRKREHVGAARESLHWLPIRGRIRHKVLTLAFKCQHGLAPAYLADQIASAPVRRFLRSSSANLLQKPRYKLEGFGGTAFKIQAPAEWNSLPIAIRNITNLPAFKRSVKTFLFRDVG